MAAVTTSAVTIDTSFAELASSMWAEAIWFLLGFVLIRAGLLSWLVPRKPQKKKRAAAKDISPKHSVQHPSVHRFVDAGKILTEWERKRNERPASTEELRIVAQHASNQAPERLPELVEHVKKHPGLLSTSSFRAVLVGLAQGCRPGLMVQVLDEFGDLIALPMEGASVLLKHCVETDDTELGARVECLLRATEAPFVRSVYECLLKLKARGTTPEGANLFVEMIGKGFSPTEGFCGGVLSRCADSRNLSLADAIAEYLRGAKLASLTSYKTLMKVFACGDLHARACDVYAQVLQDGIEPDAVMCACVMKFAMKCGRTELCWDALDRSSTIDSQQCLALVRAASQEGDASRVVALVRRIKESHSQAVSASVYNCALEVAVRDGDVARATDLFTDMLADGEADSKAYCTMLRGVCNEKKLPEAKQLLCDMEVAGHTPGVANYNSIIVLAVNGGNLREAWQMLRHMDRRAVQLDQYTLAVMMKAAKQVQTPREAERILALLDGACVDICSDAVLLNTTLDACVYHKDKARLEKVVDAFSASGVYPSVQSYGLLIRACGFLGRTRQCEELWSEMARCDIEPTTLSFGCMIDALVNAGLMEKAVALFEDHKDTIPMNTVIFSTLLKGYANAGQADRAMQLYEEVEKAGLNMNLVSYTTLINAQTRVGNMELAMQLLEEMEKKGIEPNVITYSTVIKGHCHSGKMDLALKLLSEMLDRGLALDVVVFNTLLDGCVRHSHFELADQFLADMSSHNVAASNFTLSIIVKLYGKRRSLDRAFDAVRCMPKQHGFYADVKVANGLITACFHNNAADRAFEAFRDMQQWPRCRGFQGPDEHTYSTMVQGLSRCGRFVEATTLVEEVYGLNAAALGRRPEAARGGLRPQVLKGLFKDMAWGGGGRRLADLSGSLRAKLQAAKVDV